MYICKLDSQDVKVRHNIWYVSIFFSAVAWIAKKKHEIGASTWIEYKSS